MAAAVGRWAFAVAVAVVAWSGLTVEAAAGASPFDSADNVFSPEGTLKQLAFVEKAAQSGALCVGIECRDGVLLTVRKSKPASLAALTPPRSTQRIYGVGDGILALPSGIQGDGRALAEVMIALSQQFEREWGTKIDAGILADNLGAHVHNWSLKWSRRAYACITLLADSKGLWVVDCMGGFKRSPTCAVGDGSKTLKALIDQEDGWRTFTVKVALKRLREMIESCSDLQAESFDFEWEAGAAQDDSWHPLIA